MSPFLVYPVAVVKLRSVEVCFGMRNVLTLTHSNIQGSSFRWIGVYIFVPVCPFNSKKQCLPSPPFVVNPVSPVIRNLPSPPGIRSSGVTVGTRQWIFQTSLRKQLKFSLPLIKRSDPISP